MYLPDLIKNQHLSLESVELIKSRIKPHVEAFLPFWLYLENQEGDIVNPLFLTLVKLGEIIADNLGDIFWRKVGMSVEYFWEP